MRTRIPLYAKILGWFFLNVVLLVGVVVLLFNAQFSLNLEWLFTTGARDRFEALRSLIVGDLNASPPDEWHAILERYSEAQGVKFGVYDEQANLFVGETGELPADVRERVQWWADFGRSRRGPDSGDRSDFPRPPSSSGRGGPEGRRRGWRPPLRALVRSTHPTHYWLLSSTRLEHAQTGEMRVLLAAKADSLGSGGLILDLKPWITVGAGAIAFSLLFWLPLIRGITKSIGQMTQATRQIADGRFDVRVSTARSDELGLLGEAVNDMATRLDGFVKGQKRFLGDIAHELCTPLAKLQMALGVMEQQAGENGAKYTRTAAEKAGQMGKLINELLYFSKASFGPSAVQLAPVSVREAVDRAIQQESTEGMITDIAVAPALKVMADPELLVRALGNLLRNAIRYAGSDGPIKVSAAGVNGHVKISVADTGPGVAPDDLPRIFDAFYRVDTARRRETGGTGLGLTIVKTCVEACGGTISAQNRQPHGLEVTISLPKAEA
jgi:two-component system sensor histidine kinase CpxA